MIRVDAVWLAVAPIDMRAGTDTVLARVVSVFGCAHPHHAYVITNRRANRIKVLVHDGLGIWLCARRLHQGRFVWPKDQTSMQISLTRSQFDPLNLRIFCLPPNEDDPKRGWSYVWIMSQVTVIHDLGSRRTEMRLYHERGYGLPLV